MLIHLIKISFKHFLWGRLKFWKTRNFIRHFLDQEELALVGREIKKKTVISWELIMYDRAGGQQEFVVVIERD